MTANARERRRRARYRMKAAPQLTVRSEDYLFRRLPDGTPELELEQCLADPLIYKTPAGSLVRDDHHFFTPDEARHLNGAAIDRDNPGRVLIEWHQDGTATLWQLEAIPADEMEGAAQL